MQVKLHLILQVFVFLLLILKSESYIDVFLEEDEVERLLGVKNSQLYYVRDGVVNRHATEFVGRLADDEDINLTWKSTSVVDNVLYDVRITEGAMTLDYDGYENTTKPDGKEKKLLHDQVNKTDSGNISYESEIYHVNLTCTGEVSGHVDIDMSFTFHFQNSGTNMGNYTIGMRRVKYCTKVLRIEKPAIFSVPVKPKEAIKFNDDQETSSDSTKAFFISVSVFTTLIFVFVFVVAIMHCRSTRRQNEDGSGVGGPVTFHIGPQGAEISNQFLRPDLPNNVAVRRVVSGGGSGGGMGGSQGSSGIHFMSMVNNLAVDKNATELSDKQDLSELISRLVDITLDKDDVFRKDVLMKGTFARICEGSLSCGTSVLIKTVSAQATLMQKKLLITESCLLKSINHPNLLKVIHFVSEDDDGMPMILYPYVEGHNLKYYLQGMSISESCGVKNLYSRSRRDPITSQELVEMAMQIAYAMEHLAQCGVVHKDLATRNCIVSADGKVRVTDNSLSRDIFPADYCCLGDNENRPVRWLALESLIHKIYTTSSDVWSFGVVLWELQSLGCMPYMDIDDFEMESSLRDGYRLSRPISCPEYLYKLMVKCWHYSPRDRPTFTKLRKSLAKFRLELLKYV